MPRAAKSFEDPVEQVVMDVLQPIAGRLGDALYELQVMEDVLERLLAQVREKKAVIEKAQTEYGTP